MNFREYPKMMSHPGHQQAVWKKLDGPNRGWLEPDTIMISPERLAPITVHTLEQEKEAASKGYRPNNMANAAEYEQTILEGQISTEGFQEFPKFKYHAEQLPVIVNNAAEEKALGAGWGDSPVVSVDDEEYVPQAAAKVDRRTKEGRALAAAGNQ